jgi:hypothetical protein
MAIQFKKTRLAAAVATAAVTLGLSTAANAVVVVGGDNGWEVSFDGNVNAFYNIADHDEGFSGTGWVAPVEDANGNGTFVLPGNVAATPGTDQLNTSRIQNGFLPAFFSFNVKSPTVNGMTGTARISFAPQISSGNTKNNGYLNSDSLLGTGGGRQGASIDMREVLVNLEGGFGTASFGRTLSIFGRNAVLKDMTLFGVGGSNLQDGGTTFGRIGRGYTYPDFAARFSYKTPNLGGFQAEVGLYDPSVEQVNTQLNSVLDQTDTPRFEAEANYTTAFSGGSMHFWADALYQDLETASRNAAGEATVHGWGVGAEGKYAGFSLTGYYYGGQGLGRSLQFHGGTACDALGQTCEEADNDGYYVQGMYTFNGKTKLGMSYGQSTEDAFGLRTIAEGNGANERMSRDVELDMWTIGVYHDMSSWLKLVAEYSHQKNDFGENKFTGSSGAATEADIFSVGTFFFW